MVVQRSSRIGPPGDLRRDAAYAGGSESSDQQDRPQRRPGHRADDACGALSDGTCEDATKSEAADAADAPKLLQSKAIAIDNDLRATLRNFGLKVGMVGTARFDARIRELVADIPDLAILVEPLLIVRQALREQFGI